MITELEFETSIISCINLCMYVYCTKISPKFEFGVRGQSAAFFFWSGPRGALRAMYVWENIFSIAGMAGVAVGHTTTSVSK